MRQARLSEEERQRIFDRIDRRIALEKRRHRLYNRKYRKSPLFISTWVVRVVYIVLFFSAFIFNDHASGYRQEVVLEKTSEDYLAPQGRRRQVRVYVVNFETEYDRYESRLTDESFPHFDKGDTVIVERNFLHKPSYFSKRGWSYRYPVYVNWVWYFVIVFITIISLFFNDGLERFTDKFLWVTWTANLVAMYCYFFG